MRLLRAAAFVVICLVAALAFREFCLKPYRCNKLVAELEPATLGLFETAPSMRLPSLARRNLKSIEPCLDPWSEDVASRMIAAANLRFLQRPNEAVQQYQQALRWDRRPELYLQLGLSLLEAGHSRAAIPPLINAVRFEPSTIHSIDDPAARRVLWHQVSDDQARLGNLVRNGDFRLPAPRGYSRRLTGDQRDGQSAAAAWRLSKTRSGVVECEIVPSARGRVGPMLHIVTSQARSGVVQVWGPTASGPPAVITSAWVFVVRGQACIGSGAYENVTLDATSSMVGQWQQIAGRSQSCPASQSVIFANTDATEFYVTDVQVHAVPAIDECNARSTD